MELKEKERKTSRYILNLRTECGAESWIGRRFGVSVVHPPVLQPHSAIAYSLVMSMRGHLVDLNTQSTINREIETSAPNSQVIPGFESRAALWVRLGHWLFQRGSHDQGRRIVH